MQPRLSGLSCSRILPALTAYKHPAPPPALRAPQGVPHPATTASRDHGPPPPPALERRGRFGRNQLRITDVAHGAYCIGTVPRAGRLSRTSCQRERIALPRSCHYGALDTGGLSPRRCRWRNGRRTPKPQRRVRRPATPRWGRTSSRPGRAASRGFQQSPQRWERDLQDCARESAETLAANAALARQAEVLASPLGVGPVHVLPGRRRCRVLQPTPAGLCPAPARGRPGSPGRLDRRRAQAGPPRPHPPPAAGAAAPAGSRPPARGQPGLQAQWPGRCHKPQTRKHPPFPDFPLDSQHGNSCSRQKPCPWNPFVAGSAGWLCCPR